MILSNLHVNDNAAYIPRNETDQDSVCKIRPFLHRLLTHFQRSFSTNENLTIDAGVCGFWGRVIFHVTSVVSRCLQCVTLRQGMFRALKGSLVKVNRTTHLLDCFKDYCLVMLIRGIQLFMDRFYSSSAVTDFLWARKTKAVATCMPNQKELPRQYVVS